MTLRRILPAFWLLVAITAATSARAQTTPASEMLSAFDKLCVATDSDRAGVLAAADAAGWSPVPDALLGAMAAQFRNAAGRMKAESSGLQFVFVGEQTIPLGGRPVRMRLCGVGAVTPEEAAVKAGMQSRAAVAPSPHLSIGDRLGWAFSEKSGAHVRLDETSAVTGRAALASGRLRVLAVQKTGTGDRAPLVLALAVPLP